MSYTKQQKEKWIRNLLVYPLALFKAEGFYLKTKSNILKAGSLRGVLPLVAKVFGEEKSKII